jgi:hypothetical protein
MDVGGVWGEAFHAFVTLNRFIVVKFIKWQTVREVETINFFPSILLVSQFTQHAQSLIICSGSLVFLIVLFYSRSEAVTCEWWWGRKLDGGKVFVMRLRKGIIVRRWGMLSSDPGLEETWR